MELHELDGSAAAAAKVAASTNERGGRNGASGPSSTPPSPATKEATRSGTQRSQSLFGVVASLQQVHYVVRDREKARRAEWVETKPLLEQKRWAMVQQQKICTRELDNLVKGSDSKVEKHRAVRARRLNEIAAVYKPLLEKFYAKHNPAKIAHIPTILQWYRGREHLMIAKLDATYGESLDMTALMNAGALPDDTGEPRKDPILEVLDAEGAKLWDDVLHLEQIYHRTSSLMEEVKQELYFPRAHGWAYRFGIDGVYGAVRDFWIEQVSGRLIVQIPDTSPQSTPASPTKRGAMPPLAAKERRVDIRVCGAGDEHAVVAFRCDSIGLRGEKGTKVPGSNY